MWRRRWAVGLKESTAAKLSLRVLNKKGFRRPVADGTAAV